MEPMALKCKLKMNLVTRKEKTVEKKCIQIKIVGILQD